MHRTCPLSGVKRTSQQLSEMSASDPTETWAAQVFRSAKALFVLRSSVISSVYCMDTPPAREESHGNPHRPARSPLHACYAAVAWPVGARAQQPGKLPLVGMLVPGTQTTHGQWFASLVQRLRELGWIEGRTVAFEYRWAEGRTDRAAEIAADFVRLKVDVIVTSATAPTSRQSRPHRASRSSLRVWRTQSAAAL